MILFLYIIFVLLASILGYFYAGDGMNSWFMSLCSMAMGGASILFCKTMHLRFQNWGYFSASSLFCLSFWIVHFFYALLLIFYEEVEFFSIHLWPHPDRANYTTLVSVLAFSGFYLGYLSLALRTPHLTVRSVTVLSSQSLSRLSLAAPLISILNFVCFISVVGPTYLSGGYAGSGNWGSGATYFFQFFELFFYLSLILEVYKIKLKNKQLGVLAYALSFNWLTIVFLFAFIVFNLYIGDRGPILTSVFIVVGGYDLFIKRFRLVAVVLALILGIAAMSYVSNYRTRDAGASLEERVEQAKYKLEEKRWYHAPGELGGNVRTANVGIAMAHSDGFWYGKFQAVHIMGVIPFAKGAVIYVLNIPFGLTSGVYLTMVINGSRGVGVGTTPVADVYLDFGLLGIIIMFPCLGRFIAWLELNAFSTSSVYHFVVYLWLLSEALYWPRAVFFHNLNEWLWALFILWVVQKTLLRSRRVNESVLWRPMF